jgi:hypothetical protein
MTADIVTFPARPAGEPITVVAAQPGDIVVTCVNAAVGLWAAWPVAVVDDDGVVLGVHTRAGKMIGVGRMSCATEAVHFRAVLHDPEAFAALRWKTWPGPVQAAEAFAAITRADDV